MLKFRVFDQSRPAQHWPLRNAHLVGSDRNAMRAEITFSDGLIVCQKREAGVCALALQQPTGECGELTIQTCLLPPRQEPYLLNVELARHRLMLVYNKMEEWGMFDLAEDHSVSRRISRAKRLYIEALCCQAADLVQADRLAGESLAAALDASEELALAHADLLLTRRKTVGSLPKNPIGCGVTLEQNQERIRAALLANFDFVSLFLPWRALEPTEDEFRWEQADNWMEWAQRSRIPISAGPVVSFEPGALPDWLYMWEHDYEMVRDLLYEHTERVVTRYRNVVNMWTVVSGLQVNSHFAFNFDQLMELTRMCTMLVKKLQPAAKVLVEIRQPFGEYYSTNPRSIPPLMYADLLVQGAVSFDGFLLRLLMGQAQPGQYVRDLMQVSHLLDQFAGYGKPLHLSVAVPSEPVTQMMIVGSDPEHPVDDNCGYWRKPWSPLVQGRWLEALYHIVLSKPFVETIAWQDLMDHAHAELPLGGLVNEDFQPKGAFRRLVSFRRSLGNKSISPVAPLGGTGVAGPAAEPAAGPALDEDDATS